MPIDSPFTNSRIRSAEQVRAEFHHAIRVDRFVFRSIPVDMYQDPFYEIGEYPEPEIRWSKLLEQPSLVRALKQALLTTVSFLMLAP